MVFRHTPLPLKHEIPECPYEAFRAVMYRSGDVPALASRMGLKPGTLYNKADADAESQAQPTLRDLIAVTRETGDTCALDSLERMFDRVAYRVAIDGPASDAALLELLCNVGSEKGQMYQALQGALEDGRFTHDEVRRIRAEAFDLIGAVLAFVQRIEGMADGC